MAKKIIITGTSRGIGYELVKQLSAEGHQILALSRNDKPIRDLQLENGNCFSFDITQEDSISEVSAFVKEHWKSVDVVINNSGYLVNKPFLELTQEDVERSYKVNVFGVIQLLQAVVPFMNNSGHVVNISSMGGVMGSAKFPGLSAYSSSKGALVTLSEVLAEEFKENGPACNVLALGAVNTEMLQEAFPGYEAPLTAGDMASYIAHFALTGHQFYNGKVLPVSNSTP